jgi:hypothetical protein
LERPIERRSSTDFLVELLRRTVLRHHPPASVADGAATQGETKRTSHPRRTLHRAGGPKGSYESPERAMRPPPLLEKRMNKANPRQRKKQASRSNLQLYTSTRQGAGLPSRAVALRDAGGEGGGGSTGEARSLLESPRLTVARG